jgi:drug/metabolite transporter (DMT)-like permease
MAALKQISGGDWFSMLVVAIVGGALAPSFFFTALDLTPVNNVILIGRIEPTIILALSALALRERVNGWVLAGAAIAFIGVALTVLLPSIGGGAGFHIGRGDLLTVGGAISAAIATVISKARLQLIPLGIFNLFRTIVGTIVFFVTAVKLFGFEHFGDVISPFLWQWMLIYSAVVVVGGQLAWFFGLRTATTADISLVSSFSPIAGVLATYAILGDAPTSAQYIGGVVILLGVVLNQIGIMRSAKSIPASGSAMDEVGYKGI